MGRLSELIVKLWYRARGYRVRDCNWRTRGGELDLILCKEHQIVFVEVRGRRGSGLVSPLDSFDLRKQYYFERCAVYYLHRHGLVAANARLDFAGVTWVGLCPRIQVIEDVRRFEC